ncbi:MAG: AI-2E family transporter [Candidatus Paceibacterota bacterium]
MLPETKVRLIFFFTIFGLVGFLLAWLFLPFMTPLILAAALALIFNPVFIWLNRRIGRWPSLSAFLTLALILVIVILPLTYLSGQVFIEARSFYVSLTTGPADSSPITQLTDNLNDTLTQIAPFLSIDITDIQAEITDRLMKNINVLFSSVFFTLLNIFIFLFGLFYFIRDGHRLREALIKVSPLDDRDDIQIFSKLHQTINSVFLGSLLIALVQGILTGIGFAIFGIPQPVMWGAVGVVLSLIPSIGPGLLFIPAIIIQFILGDTVAVIGLAVWSIVIVSSFDNIARPYLIERGIKIHPLFILISVLGGLLAFGLIGFILGPIILSLFFALLHIYLEIIKHDLKQEPSQ